MTSTAPPRIIFHRYAVMFMKPVKLFEAVWTPEAPATPRQRLAAARAKINRRKPLRFRRP